MSWSSWSLHGQWATTCPFARTFSKSALTSLLSKYLLRFIHVSSGIHRKPPWIWHSGSGAKRAFSSTGGNSRKLRERKSKEGVSLREREEGEGLKIETASIILKLPQRNRDVSVEGGSSAKVNVVSPRLLGVRGQCKQILRPYLMFPRCRQDWALTRRRHLMETWKIFSSPSRISGYRLNEKAHPMVIIVVFSNSFFLFFFRIVLDKRYVSLLRKSIASFVSWNRLNLLRGSERFFCLLLIIINYLLKYLNNI